MRVMSLDKLQKKLVAAARFNPPSDQVPYAFEKRILARLAALPAEDAWMLWGKALWRGAGACLAISVLLSIWSFLPIPETEPTTSLNQVIDSTVVAMTEQMDETW